MTRRLYVVEFRHSLGWTPVCGEPNLRQARAEARREQQMLPDFDYRVVAYEPASRGPRERQSEPRPLLVLRRKADQ